MEHLRATPKDKRRWRLTRLSQHSNERFTSNEKAKAKTTSKDPKETSKAKAKVIQASVMEISKAKMESKDPRLRTQTSMKEKAKEKGTSKQEKAKA